MVAADSVVAFVVFEVVGSEAADSEEVSGEVSADRRVQAVISQIRIFTQIILALINRRRLHPLGRAGSGWMVMATMREDSGQAQALVALRILSPSLASRSWSATYVKSTFKPSFS